MGTMPGAKTIRFPDVKSSGIDFTGKTAIAYCHNGNRGYETCQGLAGHGHRLPLPGRRPGKVAGRKAAADGPEGPHARPICARCRRIATKACCSTPSRCASFSKRRARCSSTPAIPASSRAITCRTRSICRSGRRRRREFKTKLAQLPKQPIIVPCYDRRSCFFGEVLGLELERAGYDYRGRYTVPWEFFTPTEPRPYIKEWLAENNKGWFQKAAEALAAVLSPIAGVIGLILTIILLACLSRLMILPFAVKAERDQIRARDASAEMDDIKQRLKDDPVRKTRAIRAFYKRHGMTPGRNLIAMLFLPIMAVALLAVQDLAAQTNASLPWIAEPCGSRSLADPAAGLRRADHGLCRPRLRDLAHEADRDLAGRLAGADRHGRVARGQRRHLSDHQRHVAGGAAAVGERPVRRNAGSAWRRSRTPEGIIALEDVSRLDELRQQGLSPRPDARGRDAGAGWRRADARLHDADGRRARVDPPPRARLDLAAPRQRASLRSAVRAAARTAPTTASPACSSR